MSSIVDLVTDLCPNGVEYRPLWSVTVWDKRFKGVSKDKQEKVLSFKHISAKELKTLLDDNGTVKLLSTGNFDGYTNHVIAGEFINHGEVIALPSGGYANIKYHNGEFVDSGNILASTTEKIECRFLYHYLSFKKKIIESMYRGSGIKHPDMAQILNLSIPVPPLSVQNEIVRILDGFIELAELLNAELSARKKQYEYYLDYLLENEKECNEYELQTICDIIDCPHTSPVWKESGIPVIRNYNLVNGGIDMTNLSYVDEEEYINRVKRVEPRENDILFSREAPIGNVAIIPANFKCCQGQRVVLLRVKSEEVLPKYLLYVLQGNSVRSQIGFVEGRGATVSNFNISDLKKLRVSFPSKKNQNEKVQIIDSFSDICNDSFGGLPAEIAARKKQFEYYREKLLAFKEAT